MATVIRLQRRGRKKRPFYSIVVMDKRDRRDGAFIERLGYYDPCREPEAIRIDLERVQHWLARGAQTSDRVKQILRHVSSAEAGRETAAGEGEAPEA